MLFVDVDQMLKSWYSATVQVAWCTWCADSYEYYEKMRTKDLGFYFVLALEVTHSAFEHSYLI